MTIEIVLPHLLLVEGKDEEQLFEAYLKHLQLQNIQILPIAGKDNLRPNLRALVASPRFAEVVSIGVIRDGNANPTTAFQSVRDALQAANLAAPQQPLTLAGQKPRVAIMILPDEKTPGMLEDLCLKAVAQDSAMLCAEEYFQCLQRKGIALPKQMSKAKVHVFLASRSEPDKRLGEAAQAGYWPWDSEVFNQVKDFLRQIDSQG